MKKIVNSALIRYFVILLAVITGCICVISLAGVVVASFSGIYSSGTGAVTAKAQKNLLALYSRYIFEAMKDKDQPDIMEDSNMEYTIIKGVKPDEDINSKNNLKVISRKENIIYSNNGNYLPEITSGDFGNCQFFFRDERSLHQPVSIIKSLFNGGYQHPGHSSYNSYQEYVKRIFYMDGIFYMETENYAFPVKNISIKASDLSDDDYKFLENEGYGLDKDDGVGYTLETASNGKMFYRFNGYYTNIILDAAQYKKWSGIIINDIKFFPDAIKEGRPGKGIEIFKQDEDYYECYNDSEDGYVLFSSGYSSLEYLNIYIEYEKEDTSNKNVYAIVSNVRSSLSADKDDLFFQQERFIRFLYNMRDTMLVLSAIMAVAFIILLIYCCYSRYVCPDNGRVHRNIIHRIPFIVYLSVMAGILAADIYAGMEAFYEAIQSAQVTDGLVFIYILSVLWIISCIYIFILLCLEISCRAGAGIFLKSTLIYYIYTIFKKVNNFIKRNLNILSRNLSLFIKTSILLLVINMFFLVLLLPGRMYGFFVLLTGTAACAAFDIFILKIIVQMEALQKHAREMAGGNLESKVDTSKMHWELKKHGEYLNQIGEGMAMAVDEKMKSERFKTELITNVSHDIKTPLTSIINYVDLLKKEKIEQPGAQEYLEVLERQSTRLKKLIEDLMEASKASTGNIAVNLELCDINILLTQTLGEFEEKLNSNGLVLVIDKPAENIFIMADNRHIWRVFDNLMTNILKYGQAGTRVYINLEADDENAFIIFRNTSNYQLNITGDELLERFVRGDSSRHTEGSGLGLSIARNLTGLMGGELDIYVDGDLFKARLKFPRVQGRNGS